MGVRPVDWGTGDADFAARRKWKLSVYGPGDHPPPHFHIIGPDHDVIVHAVSFQPLGGTLTGVPEELLNWARTNQDVILAMFQALNPTRR